MSRGSAPRPAKRKSATSSASGKSYYLDGKTCSVRAILTMHITAARSNLSPSPLNPPSRTAARALPSLSRRRPQRRLPFSLITLSLGRLKSASLPQSRSMRLLVARRQAPQTRRVKMARSRKRTSHAHASSPSIWPTAMRSPTMWCSVPSRWTSSMVSATVS